jgi:acyl-CoA synthetase (AMP-forming)/AMP-acid ligase II
VEEINNMNIGESLPRNAQHFPNKPAIVDAHRAVTYIALHQRTNRLANYLLGQGIKKGDLVGLSCGSRAEHFEALFALAKIGAVAVPFDFNWSFQECAAMLDFFKPQAFILESRSETHALHAMACQHIAPARLLIVGSSHGIEYGQARSPRGDGLPAAQPASLEGCAFEAALDQGDATDPEVNLQGLDPFLLMITSGTTGFPKACSVNHETYALRCINYGLTKGMNQDERALMVLPVHFNAGRGSVMSILYLGGTIFIQEKFDATLFLEAVQREEITYTMLVPTLCERLLRDPRLDRHRTSSLRYLGITGGHLSADLARETRKRLCADLFEAYASTDCGQITTIGGDDWDLHGETVGKPIWCVLVGIIDEDGREVPVGKEGEVCVRTPLAIQGYYQNPEATEEFLRGGWCHTGDIGFMDGQGYLHISGRKKNMVKSGGISVFPEEIEDILRRHPDVADAAVIGFKSAEWGEAVKAFVVLNADAKSTAAELIQFCKNSLAPYKAPKLVGFLPALPRTGLGKIDRGKLQAMTRSG